MECTPRLLARPDWNGSASASWRRIARVLSFLDKEGDLMKKFGFIILVLAVSAYLFGCGKKQQTLEEMQEPMSMESLSTTGTQAPIESKTPAIQPTTTAAAPTTVAEPKLEAMPPAGPYKPSTKEIQATLKNAGYYTGKVDGKKGPMTKKAIEEFQKANGLEADGKVGPKSWTALSKSLVAQP